MEESRNGTISNSNGDTLKVTVTVNTVSPSITVHLEPAENVCVFDAQSVQNLLSGLATNLIDQNYGWGLPEDWALVTYLEFAGICPVSQVPGYTVVSMGWGDDAFLPTTPDWSIGYPFSRTSENAAAFDEEDAGADNLSSHESVNDAFDVDFDTSSEKILLSIHASAEAEGHFAEEQIKTSIVADAHIQVLDHL